ncbi:hypothetical protein PO600_06590 [Escherichia coli]
MTTITKERLLTIRQWRETYGPGIESNSLDAGGVFDFPLGIKTVCGKRRVK